MQQPTTGGGLQQPPNPLLREQPRWCTWELRPSPGGKPTKVPDQSTLEVTRCRRWAQVEAAPRTDAGGVGFVLTGGVQIDGRHLIALDLDGCRDPSTGGLTAWAAKIIGHYNHTYTEVTPSGTGVRVWLLPARLDEMRAKVRVAANPPVGVKKLPELQVFGLGPAGYVTVTGEQVPGTTSVIDSPPSLDWLIAEFGLRTPEEHDEELPTGEGKPPTFAEITQRVVAEPQGEALIRGNWKAVCPNRSASEAFQRLEVLALDAARDHGERAVEWLLECTAWGSGEVEDSADPGRYTRLDWVERDVARTAARRRPKVMFDPLPDDEDLPARDTSKLRIITHDEFIRRRADQLFLVDGVIPRTGLVHFYGDPSAGKTPFAISLAMHIAGSLAKWFNHDIERHGKVLYMVGEDSNGLGWRAEAEQRALGILPETIAKRLLWTTEPGQLCDAEDAKRWLKEIRALVPEGELALVVIDTQARNFGAGNENDTQDMNRFVHHIAMLAEKLQCVIVLVHHTGLANKERARGNSALFAALDASYEITREGMTVTAKPTKGKNWEWPEPMVGELVVHDMGVRDNGKPRTAITLRTEAPDQGDVFGSLDRVESTLGRDKDARALFRAIAETAGEEVSYRELAERAGVAEASVKRGLMATLTGLGLVEIVEKGKGRQKSVYGLTDQGFAMWVTE